MSQTDQWPLSCDSHAIFLSSCQLSKLYRN